MACPFFQPVRRIAEADRWTHVPRLPLGDFFEGVCRSREGEVFGPSEETVRELCCWGYSRGRCDRFPADAKADAVRFSVSSGRLIYILERDGSPVEHGEVVRGAASELLLAQARAFAESVGAAPHAAL